MKKIFVFGHRNPDTDSVTAAISLAHLKNELGFRAVPAILSSINLETKYVLDYFNMKVPVFLNDVKLKVKDLKYTKNFYVVEEDSLNDAYCKMNEAGISKIPVLDEKKKLLGIITMKDIAKEQFNENIDNVFTTYDNILEVLEGEQVLRLDENFSGKLFVASYRSTTIINTIPLSRNNILIVGDRHSVIEYAINSGVQLIILSGGHELKKEHLELARKNRVNVIKTELNTLITSRRINLANNVSTINYIKDVLCVSEHDNVSDFMNLANKTRYSYYPVVDKRNKCIGILRVSDVNYDNRKNVILVDHNSYEQSAMGLDETNIVEIVDHHNIGKIGTNMPINFRNMPVGSTNTIIFTLYRENNIEVPANIAGLMLSGILSDTLILTSPTTTEFDKVAVEKLSEIAGVDFKEYGLNMLKAGSSLKDKTKEEILYTDYKVFPIGDVRIGIGQLSTIDSSDVLKELDDYVELLNNVADANGYYFVALFVTNIIKKGSYVLCSNRGIDILRRAYNNDNLSNGTFLKGVVSRKKQMLPGIMLEMSNNK